MNYQRLNIGVIKIILLISAYVSAYFACRVYFSYHGSSDSISELDIVTITILFAIFKDILIGPLEGIIIEIFEFRNSKKFLFRIGDKILKGKIKVLPVEAMKLAILDFKRTRYFTEIEVISNIEAVLQKLQSENKQGQTSPRQVKILQAAFKKLMGGKDDKFL